MSFTYARVNREFSERAIAYHKFECAIEAARDSV